MNDFYIVKVVFPSTINPSTPHTWVGRSGQVHERINPPIYGECIVEPWQKLLTTSIGSA